MTAPNTPQRSGKLSAFPSLDPATTRVSSADKFRSPVFTFLIGPDKDKFQVHSAVLDTISEPLRKMVTNGMKESINMQAELKDVDSETFVLFLEYAYNGMYRAPIATSGRSAPSLNNTAGSGGVETSKGPPTPTSVKPSAIFCTHCGLRIALSKCSSISCKSVVPFSFSSPARKLEKKYCSTCGVRVESDKTAAIQLNQTCGCSELPAPATVLQEKFERLEYPFKSMSHGTVKKLLKIVYPPDRCTNDVLSHAKLFLFAEQYMIDPLKALCLHKLHRDLGELKVKDSVREIVKLLDYTYEETCADIGVVEGVGKRLRELAMAYAASQAQELVLFKDFQQLLLKGGELARDFAMQSLPAPRMQVGDD